MSNTQIVLFKDSPIIFWDLYSKFLENFEFIHPLYCENNYFYEEKYFSTSKNYSSNVSFLLKEKDVVYFAFLGIITKDNQNKKSLSFFDKPCFASNLNHLSKNQKKIISQTISDILLGFEGQFYLHDFYFKNQLSYLSEFLLLNFNSKLEFVFKRNLNLEKDESVLKSNVRKSYKSLINWGIKELNIKILHYQNIEKHLVDKFKDLHFRVAQRQTRNDATWDCQYQTIKSGKSFMVAGFRDDEMITAGYFLISRSHCFYHSSASRRDLFDKPLFHSILWTSISFAKKMRIKCFDLGQVYIENQKSLYSAKQITIADFKSGFGGQLKPEFLISCCI